MKRDISDLLDAYVEETLNLEDGTPLSPSRIKELTMKQITEKKTGRRRIHIRVLAAAAVIAALSASALAVNYVLGAGTLFRDVFQKDGKELTDTQVAVMDQMGKTFEGGVTSGGTTMTPIAALADEHVYYLRLRIEAPEDVVLPDLDPDVDGYYQLFGNQGPEEKMTLDTSAYQSYGYGINLEWLPDSDPTDNVKEVVIRYTAQPGTDLNFNDGVSKLLTIHGLWIQSPYKGYTQILSGEFAFDIGMYYESKVLSLDCTDAVWKNETYGYTNALERLELSPLSIYWEFQSTVEENDWFLPGVGPLQIVLKDGTVFWPESRQSSGVPSEEDRGGDLEDPRFDPSNYVSDTYVTRYEDYEVFDKPLDLTRVDYVQYGEIRIPVSAE